MAMAPHEDGENDFSDDDFLNDIPADALEELENNAIAFTQAQIKQPPSSDYGDEFDDDDLDDAVVVDEARSAPAVVPYIPRSNVNQAARQGQFQPRYGDTNIVNRPINNLAHPLTRPPDHLPPPYSASVSREASTLSRQGRQSAAGGDDEALRKLVHELLQKNQALELESLSKNGEISILRGKIDKSKKEWERTQAAKEKLHAEQLAKLQKDREAAEIAARNAAIERDFTKQDLFEETERVRKLNRAKNAKDVQAMTPKKTKPMPFRDGFDDDEIEVLSPSKISPSKFLKRPPGTPSRAAKRKRKANDSPSASALDMILVPDQPLQQPQKIPSLDESILERLVLQDDRSDFLAAMLDHRPNRDHLRTLEALGKHALPSCPNESFSSLILGQLPRIGAKRPISEVPSEFCLFLIHLWSKCMDERYYTPIYLFVEIIKFALELKTLSIVPHIIDQLIPLVQKTADLVAIPRFKNELPDPYDKDINVSACLALTHLTALGCVPEQEHITRFWKLMRWDFVLLMLSQNQPVEDFEWMLRILSTGILKDSFGSNPDDNPKFRASTNAGHIIERLTYPLFEVLPMSLAKVEADVVLRLRIQIILLMTGMTRSSYAANALVSHPNAIGRVVSLISDELDGLYDHKAGRKDSASLISLATRLLFHLVTQYEFDMQKKLSVIRGGSQKYLLCLARLNFSEDDLVFESGIDPDIPGCALEMLEMVVTPEEGDAIQEALSSQIGD